MQRFDIRPVQHWRGAVQHTRCAACSPCLAAAQLPACDVAALQPYRWRQKRHVPALERPRRPRDVCGGWSREGVLVRPRRVVLRCSRSARVHRPIRWRSTRLRKPHLHDAPSVGYRRNAACWLRRGRLYARRGSGCARARRLESPVTSPNIKSGDLVGQAQPCVSPLC
jgi:hypothetical protein